MSGGSFDHSSHTLESIAEQMAAKLTHGGVEPSSEAHLDESDALLDLPQVAAWLPPLLMQMAQLVREVDLHLAHDAAIKDESAWLVAAQAKLVALVSAGPGWMCPYCSDHFGPDDEDTPPVCQMCAKAGKS